MKLLNKVQFFSRSTFHDFTFADLTFGGFINALLACCVTLYTILFWNHHPWLEIYLKSLYGSVKIRGIKIWVIIWSDPLWLQKYNIFRGGVCSFSRKLFFRSPRTSWNTFVRPSVRPPAHSTLKPYKSSQDHAGPLIWNIAVKRTMSSRPYQTRFHGPNYRMCVLVLIFSIVTINVSFCKVLHTTTKTCRRFDEYP